MSHKSIGQKMLQFWSEKAEILRGKNAVVYSARQVRSMRLGTRGPNHKPGSQLRNAVTATFIGFPRKMCRPTRLLMTSVHT